MRGRHILQMLVVAGLVVSTGVWAPAQQYNLTSIASGMPGPLLSDTTPKINNRGQVVGIHPNGAGGYLFSGGAITSLPGFPADINNSGAIAMWTTTQDSVISVPPYTTLTSMGSVPPCSIPGAFVASGMNDSQAAVGLANYPASCWQPFFSFNGQMSAMGPGEPRVQWLAINNSNQVVGYWQDYNSILGPPDRAIQLINGTLTDIDAANAVAYDSKAMAINDAGQFIVNSDETLCTRRLGPPSFKTITYPCAGSIWYPYLYSGSMITGLGGLGTAGGSSSGLNLWGDVVGSSQTTSGALHGFLYISGAMLDLNSHLASSGAGWTVERAYDINDFGQIVAEARDSNSNPFVVLLNPVPVTPPAIASLTLNPPTVVGHFGTPLKSVGTVTLASAAPGGGTIIFLGSNSTLAKVPSMIRINAGSTTASFVITVNPPLLGTVTATITANTGSTSKTATLIVSGS